MLIASLGFPYVPMKTDTIHKGVCDGKVSLKILVEKSEVRGSLSRSGLRYKDNIKMGLKYCGMVGNEFFWHIAATNCGKLWAFSLPIEFYTMREIT